MEDAIKRLNPVERRIAESYKASGDACKECREYCRQKELELHGRLSFFNVGEKFRRDQYRVVFVGKNTWYDRQDVEELKSLGASKFRDCRSDGTRMFLTRRSVFWGFIQDVARQLYPDEENEAGLLDNISITNLTKCNTSSGYQDTTPYCLTENCVKILEGEMKALHPKHVVFFTGRNYDSYISKLHFGYLTSPTSITGQMYSKAIGKQHVAPWWYIVFREGGRVTHVLRTRHPQGAPRELTDEIVEWIKNERWH